MSKRVVVLSEVRGFLLGLAGYLTLFPSRTLIRCIRAYQFFLSPDHSWWAKALDKPPYCKHIPSCSEYSVQAIDRFGFLKGGWLAAKRVTRCVPWTKGGYDPVPESEKECHVKSNSHSVSSDKIFLHHDKK